MKSHPTAELWGVLVDGRLGNQLFPSAEYAKAAASGVSKQKPACLVEYGRVDVTVVSRQALPRRIHFPDR